MWNRDTDAKIIRPYNLFERSLRAINYFHLKWILNLTSPSLGTHTSSTDEMFRKQFPLYPGYGGLWHCLDAGRAEVILGSLMTLTLTSSTDKCLLLDFDWHKLWRGGLWSSNSHDIYWTTPRSHIWKQDPSPGSVSVSRMFTAAVFMGGRHSLGDTRRYCHFRPAPQ